jgi:hypothetical protein
VPNQIHIPCFHVYTGDLWKDTNFQLCEWQAQNLWIRMLLLLHDMPFRGQFRFQNGEPMTEEQIARLCHMPMADLWQLLSELLSNGVAVRHNGAIANKRMVRESELDEKKAEAGRKGAMTRWHPDGKAMAEQNGSAMGEHGYISSSSSSSSSISEEDPSLTLPKLSVEEIRIRWNTIPNVKLCDEIQEALLDRINRLRKLHPQPWWDKLFDKVAHSPFLTGQVPGRDGKKPFHASLGWVTGKQILGKVLAGDYSDTAKTKGGTHAGLDRKDYNTGTW